MTHHVFSISGGVTSSAAARLRIDEGIADDDTVTLLFADTQVEDESTYRFLEDGAADLGYPITKIEDGRTPWQLFDDKNFLGNNRVALCSRILKRELLEKWRNENCDVENTVCYLGLGWTETNRFERHAEAIKPWVCRAPLIEHGMDKPNAIEMAEKRGLPLPLLYEEGFAHANCGGACVRAGVGHWSRLYRIYPDRFLVAMGHEEAFRNKTGKDVTILTRTRQGIKKPLPLRQLKSELDAQPHQLEKDDGGRCGCAIHGIDELQ